MSIDLDASDVIDSLGTGNYSVTRRAATSFNHGRAQAGPVQSVFTIDASVQPASGRDLLRLPEGRRSTETKVVFTATQLQVGQEAGASEADIVDIDGRRWEVQLAESWPGTTGYWRCIVQATR